MSLNEEQRVVLDLDSELVVEARAGSGKTRVLVSRYLEILRQGRADVNGIVAITFTENAAAEMKERIIKEIDEHVSRYGEVNFLNREAIKKLSHAPISTIHGFSARILQENPLEWMLDPGFSVMEDVEESLFIEEAIDEFILRLWDSGYGTERGELIEALSEEGFDRDSLRNGIYRIVSLARTLHIEPPWNAFSNGEHLEEREGDLINRLLSDIEHDLVDSANINVKKRISRIRDAASGIPLTERRASRARLLHMIKVDLSGIISLKKVRQEGREIASRLLSQVDRILSLYDTELTRTYLNIAEGAYRFLRDKKRGSSLLDYEDLLLGARDLLRNNSQILNRYRKGFRFIMVDEFQDTDSIQFEIIRLLSEGGGANLFIVGDKRQSIFGFRGGDPRVFHHLSRDERKLKRFRRNHRSKRPLIEFLNGFFENLFDKDYERMDPVDEAPSDGHCVEFILTSGTDSYDWRREEAKRISERILDLRGRGYRFGDMAVLMRSRGFMYVYESALRESNIPYYSTSGGGFFSRREIRDVTVFLRYLLYPKDKIAEACVLRSPFLGASDEELLAFYSGKETVDRVSDFIRLVNGIRKETPFLTPLSLIERIMEETGYSSSALALPDGRVRYANLNKLIRIFGRLESLGFGITDVLDYLESGLGEDEEPLSQSEFEWEDSVKILTVHRAKGLEFPVVFLADLNHRSPQGRERILARRSEGFLVRYEGTESSLWETMSKLSDADDLEEEKRILYVAKTRAKELLVICLGGKKNQKGLSTSKDTFAGFLDSVIGFPTDWENVDRIPFLGLEIPVWKGNVDGTTEIRKDAGPPSVPIDIADMERRFIGVSFGEDKEYEDKPDFERLTGRPSPSIIGTLMHRFLELWDFRRESIDEAVRFVMREAYILDGSLERELLGLAENFLGSELMLRISGATGIYREVPYYMYINGKPDRGKIDLVLREGDVISLFDYKLRSDGEGIARFKDQIERYASAIEKRFGRPPKERFIVLLPEVKLVTLDKDVPFRD